MLRNCHRAVYFINAATLFPLTEAVRGLADGHVAAEADVGVLDEEQLETLRKRLEFVNGALPSGGSVLVQLSRAGVPVDMAASRHAAAEFALSGRAVATGRGPEAEDCGSPQQLLHWCLRQMACAGRWHIDLGTEVYSR